jgi:hypothetical protein
VVRLFVDALIGLLFVLVFTLDVVAFFSCDGAFGPGTGSDGEVIDSDKDLLSKLKKCRFKRGLEGMQNGR